MLYLMVYFDELLMEARKAGQRSSSPFACLPHPLPFWVKSRLPALPALPVPPVPPVLTTVLRTGGGGG